MKRLYTYFLMVFLFLHNPLQSMEQGAAQLAECAVQVAAALGVAAATLITSQLFPFPQDACLVIDDFEASNKLISEELCKVQESAQMEI